MSTCVTCHKEFPQHAMGRPRIYCDPRCAPSMHGRADYLRAYWGKRKVLTQAVVGRMGLRSAGLTPRQQMLAVLVPCPRCQVLGPRRLLDAHLQTDHGRES